MQAAGAAAAIVFNSHSGGPLTLNDTHHSALLSIPVTSVGHRPGEACFRSAATGFGCYAHIFKGQKGGIESFVASFVASIIVLLCFVAMLVIVQRCALPVVCFFALRLACCLFSHCASPVSQRRALPGEPAGYFCPCPRSAPCLLRSTGSFCPCPRSAECADPIVARSNRLFCRQTVSEVPPCSSTQRVPVTQADR